MRPRAFLSVLVGILLAGVGFAADSTPVGAPDYVGGFRQDPIPTPGQRYFTRHGLKYAGDKWSADNRWKGTWLPINTEVTLVGMSPKEFTFQIDGTIQQIRVETSRLARREIPVIARMLLGREPVNLAGCNEQMRAAILSGQVVLGMTKEQVIMAHGYPPGYMTPALASNTWYYLSSAWAMTASEFQPIAFEHGVLVEIGRWFDR